MGSSPARYHACRENRHVAAERRRDRACGACLLTPLELVGRAVRAAADKKARNLVVLDVGPFLAITDHFLLASGGSDRQVKTIAEEVEAKLTLEGVKPIRTEGSADGGWILLDYGDFVVHIFSDAMREYYDLERLWKDAERPDIPELAEAREALA